MEQETTGIEFENFLRKVVSNGENTDKQELEEEVDFEPTVTDPHNWLFNTSSKSQGKYIFLGFDNR